MQNRIYEIHRVRSDLQGGMRKEKEQCYYNLLVG